MDTRHSNTLPLMADEKAHCFYIKGNIVTGSSVWFTDTCSFLMEASFMFTKITELSSGKSTWDQELGLNMQCLNIPLF